MQIVRQAAENLVLFELVGHRHLHGAIERQVAVVDAPQHLHRGLHHVVAFQNLVAEPRAGHLDLFGQSDFLLTSQQRNFAHLRQIHANRIVGPRLVLDAGQQVFRGQVQLGIVFLVVVQDGAIQVVLFNVDNPDGIFAKIQRLVRPRNRFVFQTFQQCVVQNTAPLLSRWRTASRRSRFHDIQCTLSPERRLMQKILPPNFRAAGFARHLAKDSACGENLIARCKKPKRSRIRQSAAVRVSSTKVEHKRTTEPDSIAPTGHHSCQIGNPAVAFPSCRKPGMHLRARRQI